MNGLEEEFSDEIDFVWLNVDESSSLPLREEYGIVRRSNYVLVDAEGNAVERWFGYISDTEVADVLEEFLSQQG